MHTLLLPANIPPLTISCSGFLILVLIPHRINGEAAETNVYLSDHVAYTYDMSTATLSFSTLALRSKTSTDIIYSKILSHNTNQSHTTAHSSSSLTHSTPSDSLQPDPPAQHHIHSTPFALRN